MAVSLLLPAMAFLMGLGLAKSTRASGIKKYLAMSLARIFIPIVIIYNMVFYQVGSLSLMIFSFISAILLFYFFLYFSKDKLGSLCFSYVNMAWLGFPFAMALFGEQVSGAMVALYIGGSIFGNIWAVTAVSSAQQPISQTAKKVLQSPPVVALLLAALCYVLGVQHLTQHVWLDVTYESAKVAMTFAGMCVLGMWLRQTRVNVQDLWESTQIAGLKLIFGAILCAVMYSLKWIPQIDSYIGVMFLLFCLPPAANIVALETHYHGTGISAKYIASGTIVSCGVIAIYALLLHL